MGTGFVASLANAISIAFATSDRLAFLTITLAHAPSSILAVAKMRNVQLGQWNTDQVVALAANQFAMINILPEILTDLSADNLLEPILVAINYQCHAILREEYLDRIE